MKIPKDITTTIYNDTAKICEEITEINNLKNKNQISQPEYFKSIYIEIIKTGYLISVVEEIKTQGINLDESQVDFLYNIIDDLSEIVDVKTMDDLNEVDEQTISNFATKYKDIIPDEYLEDLVDIN